MEALIAVLLLSMCALAYAALQLRGMSANNSSLWRSKATLLAYEMSDRMRANFVGMSAGSYNNLTATAAAITDCGATSSCTTARMALLDHYQGTRPSRWSCPTPSAWCAWIRRRTMASSGRPPAMAQGPTWR